MSKRIVSGVVLAAVAIAATIAGGIWFLILVVSVGAIAASEYFRLIRKMAISAGDRFDWFLLGGIYFALASYGLWYTRSSTVPALFWTIHLLGIVWATDVGAYISGRLIGGPKIAPAISPSKTWAGLAGGMAAALFFTMAMSIWYFGGWREMQNSASPWFFGCLIALPMAVLAQAGDFFESSLKRRAGVKDSGSLIPGHGGVLDRVDGLLAVAVVFPWWLEALTWP